jgi:hypothetical protein
MDHVDPPPVIQVDFLPLVSVRPFGFDLHERELIPDKLHLLATESNPDGFHLIHFNVQKAGTPIPAKKVLSPFSRTPAHRPAI